MLILNVKVPQANDPLNGKLFHDTLLCFIPQQIYVAASLFTPTEQENK